MGRFKDLAIEREEEEKVLSFQDVAYSIQSIEEAHNEEVYFRGDMWLLLAGFVEAEWCNSMALVRRTIKDMEDRLQRKDFDRPYYEQIALDMELASQDTIKENF